MQTNTQSLNQETKRLFDSSKEVLIALSKNPSFDSVAAGLSLYLSLSASGKQATIVSSSPMIVEHNHLVGVDKVTNSLSTGGKNLIVSFPYVEGSIEKVSYNVENETFNLVIEPREGYPSITPDKLNYSFGGGSFDTIVTVGVSNLADLDALYSQNQALFSEKPIINIDTNPANSRFGRTHFIEQNTATLSEVVLGILQSSGMRLDGDIATNLLAGITSGSNNFSSPKSNFTTFEAAAICMRSGARKIEAPVMSVQSPNQAQQYSFSPGYPAQNQYGAQQPPQQSTFQPQRQPQPQRMPQQTYRQPQQPQTAQQQSMRPPVRQPIQQSPSVGQNQPQNQQFAGQQKKKQDAPPDWLKPKIYKGSTLL